MLEVKKENIIKNNLQLFALLFLLPLVSFGQYSNNSMQQDSINQHILLYNPIIFAPVQLKGIQIDRKTMPIFCKWELDIQDQTRIPIKFRLGSQDYVDLLEQKNKHY